MGIFEKIKSAIFGQSAKAETAAPASAPSASIAPRASPAPSGTITRTGPAPEGPKVEWSAPVEAPVDVKAILRGLAKSKKQKLNYDKSIVDLLKLLDLRQQSDRSTGTRQGTWLFGEHKGLIQNECLAPQGGHAPARRQWWKSSEDLDGVERRSLQATRLNGSKIARRNQGRPNGSSGRELLCQCVDSLHHGPLRP